MDFLHKKVIHKTLGEGIVCRHEHPYFDVCFGDKVCPYFFPASFAGFLRFADETDQRELEKLVQEKTNQDKMIRDAWTSNRHTGSTAATTRHKTPKAQSKVAKPSIAFKCNYCDGGQNENHIGYMGPCSDKTIRYNIDEAHHSWCSDEDCPCRQYLDGEIDAFELEQWYLDGNMVCYESKMLVDWAAYAGTILKKDRKDEPKKIRNAQLNGLAILTTREPYVPEEDRIVFGVFLVNDADEGDHRDAGSVRCTSEYRMELSADEARRIKFWKYHANDSNPEKATWSQGLYRYLTDTESAQILRDIAGVKQQPDEKAFAEDFLAHFCTIKGIDLTNLPAPNGALLR